MTLNSLQDPIWNCIIDRNNLVSDTQPLFNCRLNGNELSILIVHQPVYIGGSFLWDLVGAICLNDFSIDFRTSANKTSQITNILILFTFIISGVYIILRYTVLCHFQRNFSDIDSNEKNNLMEFENILKISTKKSVVEEVHAMSYDLLRSYQTLFYQSPNILLSIHDMTLREQLTTKFSIPQVYETSSLSFRRFDTKDKTLFRGGQVAFNRIGRNFVETDHMSSVVNLFVEINSELLFSNKLLKELLSTIFFKFTLSDLKLVADSFNLIAYLMTNGLPAVYTDCDLSISILIATLLYHILMSKRFERKTVKQIYLLENDDEIYVEAENLMENFKNIRLERVEYDFKRWNRICETITSFLPALFLRDQISLPKMFKNVTKFRSGVLYRNEELMYCSILIIVAQYSYFFHTPENFDKIRLVLHRNTTLPVEELERFESVLKNEILADCITSLEAVIDPDEFLGLIPQ